MNRGPVPVQRFAHFMQQTLPMRMTIGDVSIFMLNGIASIEERPARAPQLPVCRPTLNCRR